MWSTPITGTCLFPDALVIGHQRCAELLDTRGRESFAIAKRSTPEMHEMYLMLPQLTFGGAGGSMTLTIGRKTLQFWHTPGHSADSIVCYAKEDNILFAADTVMPLPYFVDGNYDDFLASLSQLRQQPYESIVQGHGDVVLRGEVDGKLNEDINYLKRLRVAVDRQLEQAAQQRWDASTLERALATIDLESCGKSRVLLNGLGQQLHRRNVQVLVAQRRDIFQLTAE
jgi:cyclase